MDHLAAVKNVVSPLALAGAGLLGLAVPASAASMPSVTYSCSLAGYAQGLAPLSIPAALTAQSAAGTVTVTLTTQPVPMRLTTAAPATAGTPDTLMLSAPASTLGSAFPVSATPMAASGLASLGGAGGGMASGALTVPLTGLADTGNGMFRLTGPWTPRVPGMVRITAPRRFTARLREQTAVTVSVACTAATATTTTTRVMVQVAASASAAGMASEAAPAASPGAPNTGAGGSLRPGSDLPLAAGGTAAFLAGLAIVLYTLRRRSGTAG